MNKKKPSPPRKELRDVDRAFIASVMFEVGILPMEKTTLDMRRALAQLSPAEARVLKRKFRKLWRKAMKKEAGPKEGSTREKAVKARLGVGKNVPSRAERNERKQLVFNQLWHDLIGPLVDNFESSKSASKPA